MTTTFTNPIKQKLVWLPVEVLKIPPRTVRKRVQKQHEKACAFIRKTGYIPTICIDKHGKIIHGYEFFNAAVELGWKTVPVIQLDEVPQSVLSMIEVGYYKILELGEFDISILQDIFKELSVENDFDFEDIGFEISEADIIIGDISISNEIGETIPPIDENKATVSVCGDLWGLDIHNLYHGDALDPVSYKKLMGNEYARAVITDPPYNTKSSRIGGKGKIKHPDFIQAAGDLLSEEFMRFLKTFLKNASKHLVDGGLIYSAMDWRNAYEILSAARELGMEQKNCLVWNKTNAGLGSLYRSKHEFFYLFKHGTAPHLNTIELGAHGRYRSNVLDYAGVNTFRAGRMDDLMAHPTVKPTPLIADLILDCSKRNEIILDPFCGSGTIFLACERVGRRARAIELDPIYVDTAISRWETATGKDAIHQVSGETFKERQNRLISDSLSEPPSPRHRDRDRKGGKNG